MSSAAVAPATTDRAATRNVHLDAMRGLAAVIVVCTHLRQTFFVPYRQAGPGLLVKLIYIDHYVVRAAVIYFFVLSGYLVGGSVLKSVRDGRWSWREYALSRLSRLYVVLIPALVLTALLDWIGRSNGVTGWAYLNPTEEMGFAVAQLDTWRNFFGTLFFLQHIRTELYGSNTPLWSLACEFWYYLVFPVLALTLIRRRGWLAAGLSVTAIGWFVGYGVYSLFPCWLAGVAVGWLARGWLLRTGIQRVLVVSGACALLVAVVVAMGAHRLNGLLADYLITLGAMALVWAALSSPMAGRRYGAAAVLLSEMSYTLYATHLPFLLLLERFWLRERLWPADFAHLLLALVPLLAALCFAYGMYRLFEARTGEVRRFLRGRFGMRLDRLTPAKVA
jgi:peptidoglycan/LPS O-acetylase OafA/YrhL